MGALGQIAAAVLRRIRGAGAPSRDFETFRAFAGDSSLSKLTAVAAINGQNVTPTFRYLGEAGTVSDWVANVGGDLDIENIGADVVPGKPLPLTDGAGAAVGFAGADRFVYTPSIATPTIYANVGGDDWIFEALINPQDLSGSKHTLSTRSGTGYLFETIGSNYYAIINGAGGGATVLSPSIPTGWVHVVVVFDASGSCVVYTNNQRGTPVVVSGVGTIDNGAPFRLGGTSPLLGDIALAQLFQGPGWLDSHLQDAWVEQRFFSLCGILPQLAKGTAAPTIAQRNSASYIDLTEYGEVQRLHPVGSGWPRLCRRRDTATDRDDPGVISNSFEWSEDLTQTEWTKVNCSIGTGTGQTLPNGTELQAIIGTAADAVHSIATALTPSSNWKHILSCKVRKGAQGACRLSSTNLSSVAVWQQFDVDGGGVGLKSSDTDVLGSGILTMAAAAAEGLVPADWASDTESYLIWMAYAGGTASHTHLLLPVSNANVDDTTYLGDGSTPDLYASELQHDYTEAVDGATRPRAYVRTAGAGRTVGRRVTGYLGEDGETGHLQRSRDHDVAPWATSGTPTITADTTETLDPFGEQRATKVAGLGTSGVSDLYQSISGLAASAVMATGIWIKLVPGSTGSLTIAHPSGVANGEWTVDLSSLTGLWERITRSHPAVTVVTPFSTTAGGVGGVRIYQSSGTVDVYLSNTQQSVRSGEPGSDIVTAGAASEIRVKDELRYRGDDGNVANSKRGTLYAEVLKAGEDVSSGVSYVANLNDGGSSNDMHALYLDANVGADDEVGYLMRSASSDQANMTPTSEVTDGKAHQLRWSWQQDDARVFFDGSELEQDTSCAPPDDIDRIDVAQDNSNAAQLNGLVSNLRIFRKPLPNKVFVPSWKS